MDLSAMTAERGQILEMVTPRVYAILLDYAQDYKPSCIFDGCTFDDLAPDLEQELAVADLPFTTLNALRDPSSFAMLTRVLGRDLADPILKMLLQDARQRRREADKEPTRDTTAAVGAEERILGLEETAHRLERQVAASETEKVELATELGAARRAIEELDTRIAALTDALTREAEKTAALGKRVDELQKENVALLKPDPLLQLARGQLESLLRNLKARYDQLVAETSEQLATLKSEQETELLRKFEGREAKLQRKFEEKRRVLMAGYDDRLTELTEENRALKTAMDELTQTNLRERDNLEAARVTAVDTLRAEFEERITALQQELAKRNEAIAALAGILRSSSPDQ
jgi:chromosome segregation ATPase